jgi:hypothetical protein
VVGFLPSVGSLGGETGGLGRKRIRLNSDLLCQGYGRARRRKETQSGVDGILEEEGDFLTAKGAKLSERRRGRGSAAQIRVQG